MTTIICCVVFVRSEQQLLHNSQVRKSRCRATCANGRRYSSPGQVSPETWQYERYYTCTWRHGNISGSNECWRKINFLLSCSKTLLHFACTATGCIQTRVKVVLDSSRFNVRICLFQLRLQLEPHPSRARRWTHPVSWQPLHRHHSVSKRLLLTLST